MSCRYACAEGPRVRMGHSSDRRAHRLSLTQPPSAPGTAARCASDGRRVRGDEPAARCAAARHIRRAAHDRREPNTAAGSPPKKNTLGGRDQPACRVSGYSAHEWVGVETRTGLHCSRRDVVPNCGVQTRGWTPRFGDASSRTRPRELEYREGQRNTLDAASRVRGAVTECDSPSGVTTELRLQLFCSESTARF